MGSQCEIKRCVERKKQRCYTWLNAVDKQHTNKKRVANSLFLFISFFKCVHYIRYVTESYAFSDFLKEEISLSICKSKVMFNRPSYGWTMKINTERKTIFSFQFRWFFLLLSLLFIHLCLSVFGRSKWKVFFPCFFTHPFFFFFFARRIKMSR